MGPNGPGGIAEPQLVTTIATIPAAPSIRTPLPRRTAPVAHAPMLRATARHRQRPRPIGIGP
ncbi:hypothetical protein GCM10009592_18090 [Brachybacterium rhamnosum]